MPSARDGSSEKSARSVSGVQHNTPGPGQPSITTAAPADSSTGTSCA